MFQKWRIYTKIVRIEFWNYNSFCIFTMRKIVAIELLNI